MEKFATTTNKEILAGIFNSKESVTKAYIDLKNSGYSPDEVNVVMSKDTKIQHFGKDENRLSFGIRNGRLNLSTTGTGLVGAGPMVAALNCSGLVGERVGIRAALIGAGIPIEQAGKCNEDLKNGKILLTVNPRNEDDLEYISYKWNQYHAEEVYS